MSGNGQHPGLTATKGLSVILTGVIHKFISITNTGFCGVVAGRLVLGRYVQAGATGIIPVFARFWLVFAALASDGVAGCRLAGYRL